MVRDVADRVRKPSHMDVDQFALASMGEDRKEGVAAFPERRKLYTVAAIVRSIDLASRSTEETK
jgi:hypothetical protein